MRVRVSPRAPFCRRATYENKLLFLASLSCASPWRLSAFKPRQLPMFTVQGEDSRCAQLKRCLSFNSEIWANPFQNKIPFITNFLKQSEPPPFGFAPADLSIPARASSRRGSTVTFEHTQARCDLGGLWPLRQSAVCDQSGSVLAAAGRHKMKALAVTVQNPAGALPRRALAFACAANRFAARRAGAARHEGGC